MDAARRHSGRAPPNVRAGSPKLGGPLDRYVFREFWKILITTSLGFPLLLVVIDLTDNLEKYLARNLPRRDIAMSYLYWVPESMFLVLPAAVLFATIFSIGSFTRHSEITAAKASGISFYRLALPIFFGAMMAAGLDLGLAELVPVTNSRRNDLLAEDKFRGTTTRYNFAFAGEFGRVYKVGTLTTTTGTLDQVQVERRGNGVDYPTMIVAAERATWKPSIGWTLAKGEMKTVIGLRVTGDYFILSSNWIGDYLDPTTFLDLLRSGAMTRFSDSTRSYRSRFIPTARKKNSRPAITTSR